MSSCHCLCVQCIPNLNECFVYFFNFSMLYPVLKAVQYNWRRYKKGQQEEERFIWKSSWRMTKGFYTLQAEGLCVDHIMQVSVLWVKDAGDVFLLLVFPLICTLTSPSKINLNQRITLISFSRKLVFLCALFVAPGFNAVLFSRISC